MTDRIASGYELLRLIEGMISADKARGVDTEILQACRNRVEALEKAQKLVHTITWGTDRITGNYGSPTDAWRQRHQAGVDLLALVKKL